MCFLLFFQGDVLQIVVGESFSGWLGKNALVEWGDGQIACLGWGSEAVEWFFGKWIASLIKMLVWVLLEKFDNVFCVLCSRLVCFRISYRFYVFVK